MRNYFWWRWRTFGNYFARNVVTFRVDNSSLSHTDNCKNNFWALVEGPTDDINDSVGTAEKKLSIKFIKTNTKFPLSLHSNGDESYLYVSIIKIWKFKGLDSIPYYMFCLESILKAFVKDGMSEIS